MGNYVDPEAVRPPIALGPCGCPGTPHDTDYVTVVQAFGYGPLAEIKRASRVGGPDASNIRAILLGVKAWTLILPDGKPRPIDVEQVARLDTATAERLDEILAEVISGTDDGPPNGPDGSSPSGSLASGTSTPTSPVPDPSTTS